MQTPTESKQQKLRAPQPCAWPTLKQATLKSPATLAVPAIQPATPPAKETKAIISAAGAADDVEQIRYSIAELQQMPESGVLPLAAAAHDYIEITNVPKADLGYLGAGIEPHLYNVLLAHHKGHQTPKSEILKAIEFSLRDKIDSEEKNKRSAKEIAMGKLEKQEMASHKTYIYETLNIISEKGYSVDEDIAQKYIDFLEREKIDAMREVLETIKSYKLRILRAHQGRSILRKAAKIERPITPTETYENLGKFFEKLNSYDQELQAQQSLSTETVVEKK